jgi:hypothetical protein
LYFSLNIVRETKSRKITWVGQEISAEEMQNLGAGDPFGNLGVDGKINLI